ncbi:MAG TPA: metallophosphoesterase family protein [Blastocatellia bacterium]
MTSQSTYVIGDVHGRLNLLDQLIKDVPWDPAHDKIVFLGDLIDRGPNAPGVLDRVMDLHRTNPNLVVLRGNHEQMLLDCLFAGDLQWLIPENGGVETLRAYGIDPDLVEDLNDIKIPDEHLKFIKSLPFYHEDQSAIYVHAGLLPGIPVSDTPSEVLIWTRSPYFYGSYEGKLCFFGHTPTQLLPRAGRSRKFGIYIRGGCVGIDTSGEHDSPLSCIRTESFTLYQAYPNGETEVERLGHLKPKG